MGCFLTRFTRSLFASAIAVASLVVLAACGHGRSSHVLPPSAGPASGGGVAGAHRRPRTINEAAYPNAVLLDHPVAFYRLDDTGSTMADAGPNGLNGTYGSAIVRGASSLVPNTIDPGAQFPGGAWSTTGMATVPQNSALQPAAVSVEAWVSERAANSGGTIDLVSYGHLGSGQGYTLQISPSNTIEWFLLTAGGGAVDIVGTTVLTPGSAYHIVATYDGANAKIYVNGVQDASSSGGAAISYAGIGTYGLSLGAANTSSRSLFNGTLDDVSVFNSALSSAQVSAHYAAAQSFPDDPYAYKVMADAPIAYYRLDDAGTTMYDATNNRLNGQYGSGITKRVPGLVANSNDTAARFPGGAWSASSIATVGQNALLQPGTITLEAWINETAVNSSGGSIDLVSYGPEVGQAYAIRLSPSNRLRFAITLAGTPSTILLPGATTLAAGTPYHIAATWDGTTATLYLNGNVETSSTGSGTVSYAGIGAYGLALGATQATTRTVFNGTLDEVAIYGKALSAATLADHYSTKGVTASQTGPSHILTMAYYEPTRNPGVALDYMLRHVDWAVAESGDFSLVNQFRGAGGRHSMWYTDPTTIYYCSSPFGPTSQSTPGACSLPGGPLRDTTLNSDETAWLHGTTATRCDGPSDPLPHICDASGYTAPAGARLHKHDGTGHPFGEALNPGSSHVRTAYANYTSAVTNANMLDATWMDDSSPNCDGSCYISGFATSASEYTSLGTWAAAMFRNDMVGLACSASKPVIYNGGAWDPLDLTNGPAQKAADMAMLQSPCVLGMEVEGSFVHNSGRKNLNQQDEKYTFIPTADRLLLAQSMHKFALVISYTGCAYSESPCDQNKMQVRFDPVGDRLYNLASIFLIYDPVYTLAWSQIDPLNGNPHMVDRNGAFDGLVAEFGIVPTQPYQTATNNDITTLQFPQGHTAGSSPPGGSFRREFAQCYQNGASIGRCAVVVNAESRDYQPRSGEVNLPTMSHTYSSMLVLNDAPADNGGTATWTTDLPTVMPPMTAVILKQ